MSMNKLEVAGRMVQWTIELSQFDIEYHLRTTITAQALAEYIVEFTTLDEEEVQAKRRDGRPRLTGR